MIFAVYGTNIFCDCYKILLFSVVFEPAQANCSFGGGAVEAYQTCLF